MRNTKKIIVIVLLTFLLIGLSVNTFATTGKVTTETLMLRKSASTESSIVALISWGDEVEILENNGDWYKVKYNDKTGYVSAEYVKLNKDQNNLNTQNVENTENTVINNVQETSINNEENNTSINEVANNEVLNQEINQSVEPASVKETEKEVIYSDFGIIKNSIKAYYTPLINSIEMFNVEKDGEVEIISRTNKWAYIKIKGKYGWVLLEQIDIKEVEVNNTQSEEVQSNEPQNEIVDKEEVTTVKEQNLSVSKKAYIKESLVNVRKEASKDSEKVLSLVQNTEITITAESGDWYKIKTGNKEGYVLKTLISDNKIEVTTRQLEDERQEQETQPKNDISSVSSTNSVGAEKIIETAMKYLGCSYVYGASGPTEFDCSGFTQYVYKLCGYTISRGATDQSNQSGGLKIDKENLRKGDLVVFYNNGLTAIGHIGIYIGDGKFIHASSYGNLKCLVTGKTGKMVKVSTLTSGEYAKRYHSAIRIIK